ncbi:MAG: helix-turn-helix domain-containing protein [Lachnospiraceae bacterium]|nr:helix-turn-helix domain-containing protein [Lachnospiraceae bacterium]
MQIRVMVATNKPELTELLKTEAEFEKNKMKVVSWVESGEEVFRQFAAHLPRLLIVDSDIVDMDMAVFVSKVYERKDNCQILVIGDRDSTDLMYRLLNVRIWGYLARSLDIKELNAQLPMLSEIIRTVTLPQIQHENCVAMRSLYFWELMFEDSDLARDYTFANHIMNTRFQDGIFRILFFRFDQTLGAMPNFKNREFFYDLTPMQQEVEMAVNDAIYEFCYDMMFDFRFNGVLSIINYAPEYEKKITDTFEGVWARVDEYTRKNYATTVTLCIGSGYTDFAMVQRSRDEAFRAAWTRLQKGTSRVLYWNQKNTIQENYDEDMRKIVDALRMACDTLNYEDLEKGIDELFALPDYVLSDYKTRGYIHSFVDYFFEVNGAQLANYVSVEEECELVKKTLNYSYTLDIYKENLKERFRQLFELLMDDMEKQNVRTLRKAIKYIKENYNRQITAEKLAEVVNLSPVYFSHLFKKQIGMNMTDYITDYRMKIAKKKLLETDDTIYEIALSVGFQEQRYFSKRFKQIVGMTPTEFRKLK